MRQLTRCRTSSFSGWKKLSKDLSSVRGYDLKVKSPSLVPSAPLSTGRYRNMHAHTPTTSVTVGHTSAAGVDLSVCGDAPRQQCCGAIQRYAPAQLCRQHGDLCARPCPQSTALSDVLCWPAVPGGSLCTACCATHKLGKPMQIPRDYGCNSGPSPLTPPKPSY